MRSVDELDPAAILLWVLLPLLGKRREHLLRRLPGRLQARGPAVVPIRQCLRAGRDRAPLVRLHPDASPQIRILLGALRKTIRRKWGDGDTVVQRLEGLLHATELSQS